MNFCFSLTADWTDPTPVDKFCPHDEACSKASGLTPGPVVEHFNVIEDIRPGQIHGFIYAFSDPFFFSELKNDSATALTLLCQERAIGIGEI